MHPDPPPELGPPLVEEIPFVEPARLLPAHAGAPYTLLLDSVASDDPRARYSYLCLDPVETLEVPAGDSAPPDPARPDPLWRLQTRLRGWRQRPDPAAPPFQGGAAGLLGYELGNCFEALPAPAAAGARHPDLALGIYDVVAAFDRVARRAWLVATGYPETRETWRQRRARQRLDEVRARLIAGGDAAAPTPEPLWLDWTSDVAHADYLAKVRRAIDYIHAGDVFQVNLSRELVAARPPGLSRLALYTEMRERTRAPFSAYLALPGDAAVCSFSPERFLWVGPRGEVETRPIKGTRPRGRTPAEDAALAAALAASQKDRAENLMIVDLLRNDLARVCEIGSVRVPQLCGLESFDAVHHLVSVVTGRLMAGCDAVDLLRAAFPGGSITGAPKIRAMEIIHESEGRRRGPYCGSIAWLGFDGRMDSSILIRTMAVDHRHVRYGVGGGIVAESDPEQEWQETNVKAAAFLSPSEAS